MRTEAELQERIANSGRIVLTSSLDAFSDVEVPSDSLDLSTYAGIVEFSPADQVVVVRSGTSLTALNIELAESGHTIPHRFPETPSLLDATLHALVDYNLPHILEGQCGTWRDWVLGMRVILADETSVKCGSKAVKNVAGYDVQKLFIGARATLGIISELTLKTHPIRALPQPNAVMGASQIAGPLYIHRTLRSRFTELVDAAGPRLICADPNTATVWANIACDQHLPADPEDWTLRSGCGRRNVGGMIPTQLEFMRRAKKLFDPTGKLNPGALGLSL